MICYGRYIITNRSHDAWRHNVKHYATRGIRLKSAVKVIIERLLVSIIDYPLS